MGLYILLGLISLILIIGFLILLFFSKTKRQFDKEILIAMVFTSIMGAAVILGIGFLITITTVPKTPQIAKTNIENVKFGTKTNDVENSTFYLVKNKSNNQLKPAWDIYNKDIVTPKTQLNFKRSDKNKKDSLLLDATTLVRKHNENNIQLKTTTKQSYIVMHYKEYDKQSLVYKIFNVKSETDIEKYDVYLNPKDIQMNQDKVDDLNKEVKEKIKHARYDLEEDDENYEKIIDNFNKDMKINNDKYQPFIQTKGEK